jgi:hypothetical protein
MLGSGDGISALSQAGSQAFQSYLQAKQYGVDSLATNQPIYSPPVYSQLYVPATYVRLQPEDERWRENHYWNHEYWEDLNRARWQWSHRDWDDYWERQHELASPYEAHRVEWQHAAGNTLTLPHNVLPQPVQVQPVQDLTLMPVQHPARTRPINCELSATLHEIHSS